MTPNKALTSLLEGLNIADGSLLLSWDVVQQWDEGALDKLVSLSLLVPVSAAKSLECKGCEYRCYMEVITQANINSPARAFIVCDEPEKQNQMGRIKVPVERLKQWQISAKQLAVVIADLLKLENEIDYNRNQTSISLGLLKGSKGHRGVCLKTKPLELEINRHGVPLSELLFFEGDELTLDHARIHILLDREPPRTGKQYIPSIERREVGKQKTKAMYQDWHDEYVNLKRKHPGKSDKWCAGRISRMVIAGGRNTETIRKNMK